QLFTLPPKYKELLKSIGGAIIFENSVKYKPDRPNPLTMADGYNKLDILYGIGSGRDSIQGMIDTYAEELPGSLIPIGGAPGGNVICVDDKSEVFLWDHESLIGDKPWKISSSLDRFMDMLEPDNSSIGNTD